MPTSGTWSNVQWNGLRTSSGPPTFRPFAIHRAAIAEAGDAGRAGAAEERREGEREAAEEHRDEADPEGEAGGGQQRDLVAEGGVPEDVRAEGRHEGEDHHRQPEQGQVGGQLLERDAALAERRRGDEVEAAAARLAGQGPGQGEDRPEGRAEGEDRAVLEGDVAAQRADLRADQRRRCRTGCIIDVGDAPEERVHLEPGGRRREDVRHGDAHDERHPAEQAGGDDEGEARVADRLAVDAAEAVELAAERDRGEGRRPLGAAWPGRPCQPTSTASRPYWARNVSSRLGSRETKSSSS